MINGQWTKAAKALQSFLSGAAGRLGGPISMARDGLTTTGQSVAAIEMGHETRARESHGQEAQDASLHPLHYCNSGAGGVDCAAKYAAQPPADGQCVEEWIAQVDLWRGAVFPHLDQAGWKYVDHRATTATVDGSRKRVKCGTVRVSFNGMCAAPASNFSM